MAGASKSSRWSDERLEAMRAVGDKPADDAVEAVFQEHGVDAVNAILLNLVSNEQPIPPVLPEQVQTYLAATAALPRWADTGKIRRGQQLFELWGVPVVVCLFCASLPSAYAAAKGVKVLYLTARLDTDARRRVMETGQFLIDVLSVGGLEEEGKGRRTIQRVRLMHAAVRRLIKARNEQQPDLWHADWGTPINQEDLAGTLLTFSYIVVESLRRLGIRVSTADFEAYLHLWNVIGHLLGVDDEMLVRGIDDAAALVEAIERGQFRKSLEGQHMMAALMELLDELTPFHRFDDTIPPLIRHLIGDDTADLLEVPKSDRRDNLGQLESVAKWFYVHVFGQVEQDLPCYQTMSRLARPFGRDVLHGLFRLERGGERAPFAMPDHLARSWELSP